MKTIEQQRAYFALKCVERIKKLVDEKIWFEFENGDFKEINLDELTLDDLKKWYLKKGIGEILWDSLKRKMRNDEALEKFVKNQLSNEQLFQLQEVYKKIAPLNDFKTLKKDYASHAKKLPQLIVSNGLVPTLAFYKSKGKERMQIYLDLELWLKHKNLIQGNHLLEYILTTDANWLRVITTESLVFAEWLKRMAEVELREE